MASIFRAPKTSGIVILVAIFSCIFSTNAKLHFQGESCYPSEGSFDVLSDYKTNRNAVLARLTTMASTSYYNTTTVGSGQDQVRGVFSCRYDVSSDVCEECVMEAAEKVATLCLFSVEAFIAYEECRVHFANRTIAGTQEDAPQLQVFGLRNVLDDAAFEPVLSTAISGVISDTITEFPKSSRFFATATGSFQSETLSTLAQCNPDITASGCRSCLENVFTNFTADNPGGPVLGQIFTPSCVLFYRLSSFNGDSVPKNTFGAPSSDNEAPTTPSTFPQPSPTNEVPEPPSRFPSPATIPRAPTTPIGFLGSGAPKSLVHGFTVTSVFLGILQLLAMLI